MAEPEPRPPFPGDWYPDMAERGLSLWKIRLGLDSVTVKDRRGKFTVLDYEQLQPAKHRRYHPMWTTNDGWAFMWGPIIGGWVISETPAKAIETMIANARWWQQEHP